jgi:hypothetical protein
LENAEPAMWAAYQQDLRLTEATNQFMRESGFYTLTARGKLNTYALFAEAFLRLPHRSGRAGVIVPTGIATDDGNKAFFDEVAGKGRLASLYDFENREGLFLAVDSRMKFALLTLGSGEATAGFTFFATRVEHLADTRRAFILSADDIRLINPNTRTTPVFRSSVDAELSKHVYRRVSVLVDETRGAFGNRWKISFRQGLFNLTSESHLFSSRRQLLAEHAVADGAYWNMPNGNRMVPLYEAKMIHHFDHRWTTYGETDEVGRDATSQEKADPLFVPRARYWVSEREVASRIAERGWSKNWLLGWRDICRATDERTLITSLLPKVGVGNSLALMFVSAEIRPELQACLIACLSSLTCDFFARHKVGGTHMNFFLVRQLPVLPPEHFTTPMINFLVPRIIELTYTNYEMREWANALGCDGPPAPWQEDRRAFIRAEIDALLARAYGLTREQLRYVLDPTDVFGADFPSETFRVLKDRERRQFGEYRTARLVLAAWDRLSSDGTFTGLAAGDNLVT